MARARESLEKARKEGYCNELEIEFRRDRDVYCLQGTERGFWSVDESGYFAHLGTDPEKAQRVLKKLVTFKQSRTFSI